VVPADAWTLVFLMGRLDHNKKEGNHYGLGPPPLKEGGGGDVFLRVAQHG